MERAFEIVSLNDGRKVKVIENTGLDEMVAAKVAGTEMDKFGAGTVQLRYIQLAFSIKEIDGQPVKRPTNINDVRTFMGQFTSKQLAKLGKAYSQLNDYVEGEDEQGEDLAAE